MHGHRGATPVRMPETYYRVGHYILKETLGVGSFGKVKIAEDERSGVRYACKILEKEMVKESTKSIQVQKEIDSMRRLRHKNTVSLVRVLTTSTKIYILMEYVAGGELLNEIQRLRRLTEPHARFYFRQLVDGVQYCHQHGVYHRDLKPENLLLDEHGTLKITDFGLSTLKNHRLTGSLMGSTPLQSQCGTPNYVAPEIVTLGSGCVGYSGERVDAWSCGVILYVLVSGNLPFDSADIGKLFRLILRADPKYPTYFSDDLKDLIQKLLTADPTQRYTLADVRRHPWFNGDVENMPGHPHRMPPDSANPIPHPITSRRHVHSQTSHCDPTIPNSGPSVANGMQPSAVCVSHPPHSNGESILQNGHGHGPSPSHEEAPSFKIQAVRAGQSQVQKRNTQDTVRSLDSLDVKIAADFVGREVELPPRDDEKTDLGSEEDDGYCCGGSSCAGTSGYTCTDVDASDSMYGDSYAVYSDGTDYHGTDNLSESGPGTTTPGRSYYDQEEQIQGMNGEIYETENHQPLHSVQEGIPEDIPHQNGYHNLETGMRPSSNAIGPPQQDASSYRSANHVHYDDDGLNSSEPPNGRNPETNDCQNGLEPDVPNSTLNIEKSSSNFNGTVAKELSTRETCVAVVNGVDELNYETFTTENTYPLPLNGERVSRHSVTDDLVRTATSVDYDSASSTTDCRKYDGKTTITPPSSEYEGEARDPAESDTCYPTHAITVHNAVPKYYDGLRRAHSLNSVPKQPGNHPLLDGCLTTTAEPETNSTVGVRANKAGPENWNRIEPPRRPVVQSFHFGDFSKDISKGEKIETLAKEVQQLFASSVKNDRHSPSINGCVRKSVSSGGTWPLKCRKLTKGSLYQSRTHDGKFPMHKPRKKSRSQITKVNPVSANPNRNNDVATVQNESRPETRKSNLRDPRRGLSSRTARRNAPKQLRFNIVSSKKESDWVRTEADRRVWCQLMKDFDLIPDDVEFGQDSATLSERWQASLESENLSIPRFSDHAFHANHYVRPRSAQYLSSLSEDGKDASNADSESVGSTRKAKTRRSKRNSSTKRLPGYQDQPNHSGAYSQGAPPVNTAMSDRDDTHVSNEDVSTGSLAPSDVAFTVLENTNTRLKKESTVRKENRVGWSPDITQSRSNASPLRKTGYDLTVVQEKRDELPPSKVLFAIDDGAANGKDAPSHAISLPETNDTEGSNPVFPEAIAATVPKERASSPRLQPSTFFFFSNDDGRDVAFRNAPKDQVARDGTERTDLEMVYDLDEEDPEHTFSLPQRDVAGNDLSVDRSSPGGSITVIEGTRGGTSGSHGGTMSTSDSNKTTSSRGNRALSVLPDEGTSTNTSGPVGGRDSNDTLVNQSEFESRRILEQGNAGSSGHTDGGASRSGYNSETNNRVVAVNPFNLDIPAPRGVPPPPRHMPRPLSIFLSRTAAWKGSIATKPSILSFGQQAPRLETILKPNQSYTLMGVVLELCGCVVMATFNSTDKHQIKCRWKGTDSVVHAAISISVLAEELSVVTIRRSAATNFSSANDFQTFVTMITKKFNSKVKKMGKYDGDPIFSASGKLTKYGRNLLYDSEEDREDLDLMNTGRSAGDSNGERQSRVHFEGDMEKQEHGKLSQGSYQSGGGVGGRDSKHSTRFKPPNGWRRIIRSRSHPENINR